MAGPLSGTAPVATGYTGGTSLPSPTSGALVPLPRKARNQ
jgi:hypothetical protein